MANAFIDNTNNLRLTGLKSDIEGAYLNNATVTVTVTDKQGNQVAGEGWPLAMDYVEGSDGNYITSLTHGLTLVNNKPYIAVIDADASDSNAIERWGHWEFPFTAVTRTGS